MFANLIQAKDFKVSFYPRKVHKKSFLNFYSDNLKCGESPDWFHIHSLNQSLQISQRSCSREHFFFYKGLLVLTREKVEYCSICCLQY